MAGTIIADFIRTDASQLSLNVGNTTFATINASGFFSNTGTQLIAANGQISGASVIASSIPTAAIADSAITRAKMGYAGAVLQVVSTVKTDTFSTSSGTGSPATITGLSASITPSSASNKILVLVNFGQISGDADTTWGIFMFRNGTKINAGDAAGSRAVGSIAGGVPSTGGTWRGFSGSIMVLDSPSSTSSVTYTFAFGGNGSATVYLNRDGRNIDSGNDSSRTPITVTLMEIAG
jgi:hypothetical protein